MTSTNVGRARLRARRLLLAASTVLCSGLAAPALAQSAPTVRQSIDGNGVDLFLGTFNVSTPGVSIGGSDQGMAYKWLWAGGGFIDPYTIQIWGSTGAKTVAIGGAADSFSVSGGVYTATEGNGATLTYDGTDIYTYTRSDGTVILFSKAQADGNVNFAGLVTSVTKPSGDKLTFNYEDGTYCSNVHTTGGDPVCLQEATIHRVASVTSNYGYALGFSYVDSTLAYWPPLNAANWSTRNGGTLTNLAVASSPTPSLGVSTTASGGYSYVAVTDPLSRVTTYRTNGSQLLGIKLPGSSSEDETIAYTSGRVTSLTNPVGTYGYSASDSSGVRTVTVTDPLSHVTTYTFDIAKQRMTSMTDALSHTRSWAYDSSGRVTTTTAPEGDYTLLTYDARGNVTQVDQVAKSGSGVSTITTYASFDTTCSNVKTCNQPNSTTDALGNVTNYTYDSTHGGALTITLPAPTTGAIRPKSTNTYSSLQAYYKNSGGSIVASGQPVYRLTASSVCQTTSSCSGGSDEVKATVYYGPQTTGTGNNLLPVSVSKGAGDSSLTATTAFSYDAVGNRTSIDGPLSGTADTTTYRYDADREMVGVISADPDGGGSLTRRAQRLAYSAHGVPTEIEIGNVNGTTDTDWAGFSSAQQVNTTLDAADRKVEDVLTASGTTYRVIQYTYDAVGRLQCTALRMNSATWGSLPSSACTLATTGSAGPDRITKITYDNAGRSTLVQTAYGTGDQADEKTGTYNNNNTLATIMDALGNKTTYEYDGVDRLVKTRYPGTTAGTGTSSTTDYEQVVYDTGSNVTSRRLRGYASDSTKHIDFTYDHLGRVTVKSPPSPENSVSYSYDLLGRPTVVSRAADGVTETYTYDALSRMLGDSQAFGSMSYQYDLAGNRTMQIWNDGFYVTYDHLVTGEVTAIRENGATSGVGVLATYSYDNLGRRTGITRGNGTTTSYGFDSISRLTSLSHDLTGSTYDLSLGFSYNPAGQIASTTRSNDAYAYGGGANTNLAYAVNGLNQDTTVGTGSLGYDARGNLTSTGSNSYSYNSQNLMTGGPSSTSLYYDGLGRLAEYDTSVSTRFFYDGSHMTAEVANPSGGVTRRYVYGPGDDEPVVWYEGSGTTDRRFLHADERGSVIAASDSSGAAIGINSYDEYGVPATGNIGRFQYTGQAYLPELGLYYYKARIYSSRLGRFMQTDPIGYSDGMNWYGYAGANPTNNRDPSGMQMLPPWGATGMYFCSGGFISPNASDCSSTSDVSVYWNTVRNEFFDSIVVEAHNNGAFADGTKLTHNDRHGIEWIQFGYRDGDTSSADVQQTSVTCNGEAHFENRATSAPQDKLGFVDHGHQDGAPPDPNGESQAGSIFPGNGDGFIPSMLGITNYEDSSTDLFAIRPDPITGVGKIDHLIGTTPYPAANEAALRANAQAAINAKNSKQPAEVCPK